MSICLQKECHGTIYVSSHDAWYHGDLCHILCPPFPNGSKPQLAPHVEQGGNPHQGKQCSGCGQYGAASCLRFVSWVLQWQVSLSLAIAASGILPIGARTVRERLRVMQIVRCLALNIYPDRSPRALVCSLFSLVEQI
jgi:hypothetical protein